MKPSAEEDEQCALLDRLTWLPVKTWADFDWEEEKEACGFHVLHNDWEDHKRKEKYARFSRYLWLSIEARDLLLLLRLFPPAI